MPTDASPRRRRAAVLAVCSLLLISLLLAGTATAGRGSVPDQVVLPRDHFPHADAGVEWWYLTGLVRDERGRRYTVFFTIWRGGLLAVAGSRVVDLEADRAVHDEEGLGGGFVREDELDLRVGDSHLRYTPQGRFGRWLVSARGDGPSGLSLTVTPTKPYALHGEDGVIAQSTGGPSAYYSSTRMRLTGSIEVAGQERAIEGTAWLDHQWGDFQTRVEALRWDWFSCRFADRSELMLYRFVDERGQPVAGVQTGSFVDSRGRARPIDRFSATPLGRPVRPLGAGVDYPIRWRLDVPALDLRLRLAPLALEQFVDNRYVSDFWEGVTSVRGGPPGHCFVENSREPRALAG